MIVNDSPTGGGTGNPADAPAEGADDVPAPPLPGSPEPDSPGSPPEPEARGQAATQGIAPPDINNPLEEAQARSARERSSEQGYQ